MKKLISFLAVLLVFAAGVSAQQTTIDSADVVIYYIHGDSAPADSLGPTDSLSSSGMKRPDTLITNAGEVIMCKVHEVSSELIYFVLDSLKDQVCVITTESVFMIRFANGDHELGSDLIEPDYYEMGRADGAVYYKSRSAVIGTFVSGALFWVMGAGIISGVAIIAVKPQAIHNKENPKDALLETNQDYYDGYMKSARKKKMLHGSAGFVGGAATFVGIILFLFMI